MQRRACGIVLLAGLCGCASTQRVTYSVEQIPRATNSSAPQVRLVISQLRDARRGNASNKVLFSSSNQATMGNETYCINAEDGYEPNSVGMQMSETLAQHLRQRGSLRAVSVGARARDAFYLSGTLRRFYAAQKSTSISPATGALFGVVGVAIASAATPDETPGTVSIEIVDWVLYDGQGRAIAKLPDIQYSKDISLPTGTDCVVVYQNINEHLRKAFDVHAQAIERAIAVAAQGEPPAALARVQPVAQQVHTSPAEPVARPAAGMSGEPFGLPPAEPW